MSVELIGKSKAMAAIMKKMRRVATYNDNVLLSGESGSGKEVSANYILEHSSRVDEPYLPVNCAAISRPLLESTLFGHERGAFTGAVREKKGFLETVKGGTLFLDEIGKILDQGGADFLRVIENGDFMRVGGNQLLHSDVRIIAAGSDLENISSALFYRFPDVISLPPLRNRSEDIPLLVDYFLDELNRKNDSDIGIPLDVVKDFQAYYWPGNVRQLKGAVNRFYKHGEIDYSEHLTKNQLIEGGSLEDIFYAESKKYGYPKKLRALEKSILARAVSESGTIKDAAIDLGIKEPSFRYFFRKHYPSFLKNKR